MKNWSVIRLSSLGLLFSTFLQAQPAAQATQAAHAAFIRQVFDSALVQGQSWPMLEHLCKQIGHRLSGSENAHKAVLYTRSQMLKLGFDSVWLQPVMVPVWVRGKSEQAHLLVNKRLTGGVVQQQKQTVKILALGGSVATPNGGISAGVIEVASLEALKQLPADAAKGKIVFINEAFDPRNIHTFESYGHCVGNRYNGAREAADKGAVGVLVRSLTHLVDTFPHTGVMGYGDAAVRIPAAAISTLHAEQLSQLLREKQEVKFFMELHCESRPDTLSYNVVGQIHGRELPHEIIAVGGHLDSWDVGEGAHDDGVGCVHSIEALRLLKVNGYQPRRSLRAIMFMNEENGLRGGDEYARLAKELKEPHFAAIESDRGGFSPRQFNVEADDAVIADMQKWLPLFEPYGVHAIKAGGSGADVGRLRGHADALLGFVPDSQRYFDFHHAASDVLENVNRRELELGSAAIAALIYLLDQ
jgi:carboxypeptidase Q